MRYAVILAGGGGTRLWPASRRARPKQFLALGTRDRESLLAATARRLEPVVGAKRCVVVTAADQSALVRDSLESLAEDNLIAEPCGRNTAAALGLAAVHLRHRDSDAVMGAIPSDQLVVNEPAYQACLDLAFSEAKKRDAIVTVGIVPTRPETGFGYMKLGAPAGPGLRWVEGFVEKPDHQTAIKYVSSGDYLWNGGMFFVRAAYLLDEIEKFLPETAAGLAEIASALERSPKEALEVTERIYSRLDPVSIDYGVMEKTANVLTVPGDFGWNDVGAWSSLGDYRDGDENGNITHGSVVAVDAKRNIVMSEGKTLVGLVGVEDLVVVVTDDAVLVVPRERAQDVRELVAALKESDSTSKYL